MFKNILFSALAFLSLLAPLAAHADGAALPPGVRQLGSVTNGDCVEWFGNNTIESTGSPCGTGGGGVTVTGTPSSGNLTEWSGGSSITNGNLSGDVTTSNTLATSVVKIKGVSLGTVTATSGNILDGDGTSWQSVALSGDCTLTSLGAITCTKSSGTAFGTAAFDNTGTSGATIPLLNGANSWSAVQTFENSGIDILGSGTGVTTVTSDNAGASNFTLHMPAADDTFTLNAATQTLTNKSIDGSEINSGTVANTFLPTATSAALGIVKPDNTTISISSGVLSYAGLQITAGTANTLNPYTAATSHAQAHGLGATPTFVSAYLECLSPEFGYSVGDRVPLQVNQTNSQTNGMTVAYNATNTYINTSNANTPLVVGQGASAGTINNITAAKWKAVIVPYYIH